MPDYPAGLELTEKGFAQEDPYRALLGDKTEDFARVRQSLSSIIRKEERPPFPGFRFQPRQPSRWLPDRALQPVRICF